MRALIPGLLACAVALAGLTALAPADTTMARLYFAGREG